MQYYYIVYWHYLLTLHCQNHQNQTNHEMETFTGELILNIWILDVSTQANEAGLTLQAEEEGRGKWQSQ